MREYDTFLPDTAKIKQVEILPIVIIGKTTEVRKYTFIPLEDIKQENVPKSFDLLVKVQIKQGNSWKSLKEYEIKNLSDIWQDLEQEGQARRTIRDIFEKE